jgi:hypothetical protein
LFRHRVSQMLVLGRRKYHTFVRAVLCPQQTQSPSIGDAHDPSRYPGVAAKVAGLLPHDEEGVVDYLIDKVVAARHPPQKTRETRIIQ